MAWNLATYPDRKLRDPRRAIEFAKKATAIEPRNPLHWRVLGVPNTVRGIGRPRSIPWKNR